MERTIYTQAISGMVIPENAINDAKAIPIDLSAADAPSTITNLDDGQHTGVIYRICKSDSRYLDISIALDEHASIFAAKIFNNLNKPFINLSKAARDARGFDKLLGRNIIFTVTHTIKSNGSEFCNISDLTIMANNKQEKGASTDNGKTTSDSSDNINKHPNHKKVEGSSANDSDSISRSFEEIQKMLDEDDD